MILMKFGGSVLNQKIGFERMSEILESQRSEKILIIVSAFANSSKLLRDIAYTAEKGNIEKADALVEEFFEFQKKFVDQLIQTQENSEYLYNFLNDLNKFLKNLVYGVFITQELTKRTLDLILSFGEQIALKISEEFLKENDFNVTSVNATDIIVSDENFGKAKPIIEKTKHNIDNVLLPKFTDYDFILTQGFVARSLSGQITTMGFESSNLTAVLLSHLIGSKEVTIWMDVEGIRSADPKIFSDTNLIEQLNYSQALTAANCGLKIIFPEMIAIALKDNIAINFCSAIGNMMNKTRISSSAGKINDLLVIVKENLVYLKVHNLFEIDTSQYDCEYIDCHDSICNIFISSADSELKKYESVADVCYDYEMLTLVALSEEFNMNQAVEDLSKSHNCIMNVQNNIIKVLFHKDFQKQIYDSIVNLHNN